MKTDLLKIARRRAGIYAFKRSFMAMFIIALMAIVVSGALLLYFGYSVAGLLAVPFEALLFFIPFKLMSSAYSARRNPALIRQQLEIIRDEEEALLRQYGEGLRIAQEQLQTAIPYESLEAHATNLLQTIKDREVQIGEKFIADARKRLAEATREERLAHEKFFLDLQQKLRESEIGIEKLRAAAWSKKVVQNTMAQLVTQDVLRRQRWAPQIKSLQAGIEYHRQVLEELRRVIIASYQ